MNTLGTNKLLATTLITIALGLAACGDNEEPAVEDLDMTAQDFGCILDWPQVERFRVTNELGHQDEAEAVARSTSGGTYPVGTIIQVIPNEAMVKRREGWNPDTNDWEFFILETTADGTSIVSRGGGEVVNPLGSCADCHDGAEPKWDLVCSDGHGCEPLPFTPEQILMVQESDPRCQ
jgi:hypothetical protein